MASVATQIAPRKLPRQERSRALVEAILDAAARILVKRGRDAVTTNSVAVLAGVSIGSLYQYFPNREAILAAVADRHAHRIHHRVADLDLRNAQTLAEAVTRIVAALFAAHRIDPALHLALDPDLATGHGHDHHGHGHDHHGHDHHGHDHAHRHSGTKPAIVRLLADLPAALRNEMAGPDAGLAASVVAEVIHALAHAAMHPARSGTPCRLEAEAVHVALAYLRTAR